MRYFSMFSGVGGFELGIFNSFEKRKRNKIQYKGNKQHNKTTFREYTTTCIGFSEVDKYSIQTYQKHFPNHKNWGDATKINPSELPDFDLLVAGFPCQSFSIAGKREGFQDTRGTLFHEILRIVAEKRPRLLLLENVKGLLSADNGRCFYTIITSIQKLGYLVEWQVLNSKHFGVPQNRERVFIIGHLRGECGGQVFPLSQTAEFHNEKQRGIQMIQNSGKEMARIYDSDGLSPTLKGKTGGWQEPVVMNTITEVNGNRAGSSKEFLRSVQIVSHCLQKRGADRPSLTRVCDCGSGKLYKKCCGVDGGVGHLSKCDGSSYCLDGVNAQAIEIAQSLQTDGQLRSGSSWDSNNPQSSRNIRRLTPIECERLQGFPDNWTEGVSDTQRYKQMGNAVTVNVVQAIVEEMVEKEVFWRIY